MAGKKGRGTTQKELSRRIREVARMLSAQVSHIEIQAQVSDKYGVTKRAVRRYITLAYAEMEEGAKTEAPARRHQMRETLRYIMQKALAVKPPRLAAAIAAADKLCKIDGLYAPQEHTVVTESLSDRMSKMTSNDKRQRLEELLGSHAAPPGWLGSYNVRGQRNGGGNGHANGNGEDSGGGNGHAGGNGSAPN